MSKSKFQNIYVLSTLFRWKKYAFKHPNLEKYQLYLWKKNTIFNDFNVTTFLFLQYVLVPKILSKRSPKQSQNNDKIQSKKDLLANIDFFAFWPSFWKGFGSQVGAKMASKTVLGHFLAPFGCLLDALGRFLSILARFGLDLGSIWVDLGRILTNVGVDLGNIWCRVWI